ncbi:hypothetical protein PG984_012244 [Apiospora sp. TS-2023a]
MDGIAVAHAAGDVHKAMERGVVYAVGQARRSWVAGAHADETSARLQVLCHVAPHALELLCALGVVKEPVGEDHVVAASWSQWQMVQRSGAVGLEQANGRPPVTLFNGLAGLEHPGRYVDSVNGRGAR